MESVFSPAFYAGLHAIRTTIYEIRIMNRFFVKETCFHADKVVLLDKDQTHQIRDVLRLRPEDQIIVLDNAGWEYQVALTKVTHEQIVGEVLQKRQAAGEPKTQITLFQSLLTRDKFEWVLQKCTEVGVSRFVPVITTRSLVREAAVKQEKIDRWQRIITEAAEQSHRGRIPQLLPPVSFEKAMQELFGFEKCLIACEKQGDTIRAALRMSGKDAPDTVAVLVGPEGGFTDEEVVAAEKNGAMPITLGPRILRTETAAIVAATLILYELGQME